MTLLITTTWPVRHSLGQRNRTEVVHFHEGAFDLGRGVERAAALAHAAVVHQQVDVAEALEHLRDKRGKGVAAGEVERQADMVVGPRAGATDAFEFIGAAAGKHERRAFADEGERQGFADAGGGARDPDELAGEVHDGGSRGWRKRREASSSEGTLAGGAVSGGMPDLLVKGMENLLGLGLKADELGFSHMAWRALTVFCFAIALMRVADRRSLGHNAGYDVMLGVILGSVLSRGVNGQAAFFPTLGASAVLVLLHRLVGTASYHSHWFSVLVKGRARMLVQDGKMNSDELRRGKITYDDLDENLRINGNVKGTDDVAEARLERNGSISVVKAKGEGPPHRP